MLRAWDNNGRNINSHQAEFIAMDSLSRDSGYNVEAQGVRKGPKSLVVCRNMEQSWPTVNKLEMLALPWYPIEEGLQRVPEIRMLEWICHVRPPHS